MHVSNLNDVKVIPVYCISHEQAEKQIRYAMSKISARMIPDVIKTEEKVAVVCYGPSLRDTWEQVRNYKYIISCSGSHKFLIERGIIPTWHVEVDPREHKLQMLGEPHKDVEYLLASVVNPVLIDKLQNYNTKLWHVCYEEIEKIVGVYPRGEWILSGGSSVGLRALVIARFLGFKNIDVFGMDCSFPDNESIEHADIHPNPSRPEHKITTDYLGKTYHTSIGLIKYSRDFFYQMAMLGDVNLTMHGTGLLQHMVWSGWDDSSTNIEGSEKPKILALYAPETYSKEYVELNKKLHETNSSYGISGSKRTEEVLQISKQLKTTDILDYGCGKGTLAKSLPFPIKEYDPAIPGKDKIPFAADIVVCTDVLEHIEPDYLTNVLGDLARCTRKKGYFVIHTGAAIKNLPDGRNAHLIQKNRAWWWKEISKCFIVEEMKENQNELHVWVIPRPPEQMIELENKNEAKDEMEMKFLVNNDIKFVIANHLTRWRAKTLLTKEPITIQWINSFKQNDVFVDVGANMGGYSLYAAVKKNVRVFSFEPEASNYNLLQQNILVNDLQEKITSYCLALSDKMELGILNLAEFRPGSSTHQFNSRLNPLGKEGKFVFKQGSFSVPLDYLVKNNMIPQPQHIKIDVDGNEPKVILGAIQTIKNCSSILIEINKELEEHKKMIQLLNILGFEYDEEQVKLSVRKEGIFKGIGEYVFKRK